MKIALNSDLSYKLDGMTGAIMNGGTEKVLWSTTTTITTTAGQ